MHIEILVEDSSGAKLLEPIVSKLFGENGYPHSWRIKAYKGVGHIPTNLNTAADPAHRILLDQLPRVLRGYGKTPGIDAVVVVLDVDNRNHADFLTELDKVAIQTNSPAKTIFRLAVEEMEAWYLGDRQAVQQAYKKAKTDVLNAYVQDSICGTWELLADAIYPGGSAAIKKKGWPLPGQIKHEWAENIGPLLDPNCNISPSFCEFRDGLLGLVAESHGQD